MNKPTLFDIISDRLLWYGDQCDYCDRPLEWDAADSKDEVVIRCYQGQFDHMIMIGFHSACWMEHYKNRHLFGDASRSI